MKRSRRPAPACKHVYVTTWRDRKRAIDFGLLFQKCN